MALFDSSRLPMNPGEMHRQNADAEAPPDWALRYADAALRCGLKAPEIEASLISKGLPPSIAQSAVPCCFEKRLHEAKRSQIRADRLKWFGRIASLVLAAPYLVLLGSPTGVEVALFLLISLGCIWFPEILSTFCHILRIGPYMSAPWPVGLVVFAGWFLLLSAIVYAIVFK